MPEQVVTLPIGTSFRCARGLLWHVRGYIDDDYIILRVWEKRRNTWRYVVEFESVTRAMIDNGAWKIAGRQPNA